MRCRATLVIVTLRLLSELEAVRAADLESCSLPDGTVPDPEDRDHIEHLDSLIAEAREELGIGDGTRLQ